MTKKYEKEPVKNKVPVIPRRDEETLPLTGSSPGVLAKLGLDKVMALFSSWVILLFDHSFIKAMF